MDSARVRNYIFKKFGSLNFQHMRLAEIEFPDNQLVHDYLIFTSQITNNQLNYSLLDLHVDVIYLDKKLFHFLENIHNTPCGRERDIIDYVFSHNLRMRQLKEIEDLINLCDTARDLNPDKSKESTENRIMFYLNRASSYIYNEGGRYDGYDDLFLESDFI